MCTYHIKNILESNDWDDSLVIDRLKARDFVVENEPRPNFKKRWNIWTHGWREPIVPIHSPTDYLNFIGSKEKTL